MQPRKAVATECTIHRMRFVSIVLDCLSKLLPKVISKQWSIFWRVGKSMCMCTRKHKYNKRFPKSENKTIVIYFIECLLHDFGVFINRKSSLLNVELSSDISLCIYYICIYDTLVLSFLLPNSIIWSPHERTHILCIERVHKEFLIFVFLSLY